MQNNADEVVIDIEDPLSILRSVILILYLFLLGLESEVFKEICCFSFSLTVLFIDICELVQILNILFFSFYFLKLGEIKFS